MVKFDKNGNLIKQKIKIKVRHKEIDEIYYPILEKKRGSKLKNKKR